MRWSPLTGTICAMEHLGGTDAVSRLARGARSPYAMYRRTVARHPQCPPGILAVLLHDSDPSVREAAAAHPNLEAHHIIVCAASTDSDMVVAVTTNPVTPARVLNQIYSRIAAGSLRRHYDICYNLAYHPNTPACVLNELHHHSSVAISLAALRHPRASADALTEQASHHRGSVRLVVAGHRNTPADVIKKS